MYRILSLAVLLLCTEISFAQKIENTFYAGLAMSNLKPVDKIDGEATKFSFSPGAAFGYSVSLPIGKTFRLQPGLNFVQKGGKSEDRDSAYAVNYKTVITLNYFELPVNFVYQADNKLKGFFIGAGPALGMGLGGKAKESTHFDNGQSSSSIAAVSFGSSKEEEFSLFEFSVNGVVGYSFSNGLAVALNYDRGLSNLVQGSNSDIGKLTTSYFALRFGYCFYAVRKK